jgi:hypothetical protein
MEVPLKWAAWKTAFLVAIASASRCGDLNKLGYTEPHFRQQLNPPGLRFIPRSLWKQDRPGHCFQDIFIPKFVPGRKLDPVRAVLLYCKRVKSVRGSLKSLFVTWGAGKVKSPTAQTLAHWLVDCIQEASKESPPGHVTAHSTRGMCTSVALLKGVSMANILKAADWSSECVFANHYLKEVRAKEGEFASAVLGSA